MQDCMFQAVLGLRLSLVKDKLKTLRRVIKRDVKWKEL